MLRAATSCCGYFLVRQFTHMLHSIDFRCVYCETESKHRGYRYEVLVIINRMLSAKQRQSL